MFSIISENQFLVKSLCFQKDTKGSGLQELVVLAERKGLDFSFVSKKELDRLSQNAVHQGVVAFCEKRVNYTEQDILPLLEKNTKNPFLLILDCVEDPHNLGACIRSANAAGVDMVIAPKDRSVGLTPTVYKVASGACNDTPFIQVTNLATTIKLLKKNNIWVVGAAGEADSSIYDVDLRLPTALVLGNEGKGLRRLTKKECDIIARIPMFGSVSSLNVSVSAGICLFEAVRQRLS